MNCRQFQKLVLTTRSADLTDSDKELLAAHRIHCADCAAFYQQVIAMERLLVEQPAPSAPDYLSASVMDRVRALDAPTAPGWYERLVDKLRAPVPDLSWAGYVAVAVIAAMLIGGGMVLGHHMAVPGGGGQGAAAAFASGPTTMAASHHQSIEDQKEFLEQLAERHRAADMSQALSDEDGMYLVNY